MQFKDYKKYLLFVFSFVCYGFITAQPGWGGNIYLNVDCEKYDVLAYAFKDSDSLKTLETKVAVTELIPIEISKFQDGRINVKYIQKNGSLCNKLLIEIYDKQNTNRRMTILAVGGLDMYPFPLIAVDINFEEGLFLIEIPANRYNFYDGFEGYYERHKRGGWDLTPALKKLY